jgi:hypothetical protein
MPAYEPDHSAVVVSGSVSGADSSALREALDAFNVETTGYRDDRDIACFLHDTSGAHVAGIEGFTWAGFARIELDTPVGFSDTLFEKRL